MACAEVGVTLHTFLSWHYMEIYSQLHTLHALYQKHTEQRGWLDPSTDTDMVASRGIPISAMNQTSAV